MATANKINDKKTIAHVDKDGTGLILEANTGLVTVLKL